MIVGMFGEVIKKELNFIHFLSHGTVYQVEVSINTSSELSLGDDKTYLNIVQIIKEDSNKLYGFYYETEKKLFELVLSVTGVGPKSGIAICSTYSFEEFSQIISESDLARVTKIPGIGPKSGKQILLHLSGKLVLEEPKENENLTKAIQALESLGFKKTEIKNALKDEEETDLSELIKIGLKNLKGI